MKFFGTANHCSLAHHLQSLSSHSKPTSVAILVVGGITGICICTSCLGTWRLAVKTFDAFPINFSYPVSAYIEQQKLQLLDCRVTKRWGYQFAGILSQDETTLTLPKHLDIGVQIGTKRCFVISRHPRGINHSHRHSAFLAGGLCWGVSFPPPHESFPRRMYEFHTL